MKVDSEGYENPLSKKKKSYLLSVPPIVSKARKFPKVHRSEFASTLVEIRSSKISGAGLGVFAKTFIQTNTKLGEYKGKLITEEEYDKLGDHRCEYIFEIERRKNNKVKRFYVDARFKKHSNWTRYVNGAKSKEQQEFVNIGSYQYGGKLFYRTNKDVHEGEELLVDYGSDYWSSDEEDDSDSEDEEDNSYYLQHQKKLKMDEERLDEKEQEEDDSYTETLPYFMHSHLRLIPSWVKNINDSKRV